MSFLGKSTRGVLLLSAAVVSAAAFAVSALLLGPGDAPRGGRNTPAWDGWSVVAVPVPALPEGAADPVPEVLSAHGLDAVSASGDEFDPYFSDESGAYRLYFVPEAKAAEIPSAAEALSDMGIPTGVGGGGGNPPAAVLLAPLAVAAILLMFTRFRAAAFGSAAFAALPLFRPYPAVCAACAASAVALWVLARAFGSRGLGGRALSWAPQCVAVALPSAFLLAQSAADALLFALASLYALAVSFWRARLSDGRLFRPSADGGALGFVRRVRPGLGAAILAVGSAMLVLTAAAEGGGGGPDSSPRIRIPAPVADSSAADPRLPSAEGWAAARAAEAWGRQSAPYRRAGEPARAPSDGETVSLFEYAEEGGRIVETERVVLTFDEEFRRAAVSGAPASFRLVESQGGASFGYVEVGGGGGSPACVLLVLIPLASLLYDVAFRRRFAGGKFGSGGSDGFGR